MPQYPGGTGALMKFLDKNIKYPEDAKIMKIEGTVVTHFVITKTGEVKNVSVLRSLSKSTDAEVVRIIKKMPKWTPGKDKKGR